MSAVISCQYIRPLTLLSCQFSRYAVVVILVVGSSAYLSEYQKWVTASLETVEQLNWGTVPACRFGLGDGTNVAAASVPKLIWKCVALVHSVVVIVVAVAIEYNEQTQTERGFAPAFVCICNLLCYCCLLIALHFHLHSRFRSHSTFLSPSGFPFSFSFGMPILILFSFFFSQIESHSGFALLTCTLCSRAMQNID